MKLRSWRQDGPKMEVTGFPRIHLLYIGTSSRTLKTLIAEMSDMAHVCSTGLHRRLPPSNYDFSLLIGVACRCPHADSANVFLNWYQRILDGHFIRYALLFALQSVSVGEIRKSKHSPKGPSTPGTRLIRWISDVNIPTQGRKTAKHAVAMTSDVWY